MKYVSLLLVTILGTSACVLNYDKTLALAEKGDSDAQFVLGNMYFFEWGLPEDDTEISKWYRMADDQVIATIESNLGTVNDDNRVIPENDNSPVNWYRKNAVEAAKWYKKAAEQGHAKAQFYLGDIYHRGRGAPKNVSEGLKWFRKAADQGYPDAQINLAIAYKTGVGVSKNDAEAFKWFKKAAEQGHADVQGYLGRLYRTGQGTPQNKAEAEKWYKKASKQGDFKAQNALSLMEGIKEGDADSQAIQGFMHQNGVGTPQNDVEAAKLLEKAAKQGHEGAQQYLELIEGVREGDAKSQTTLGWMYLRGDGGVKDDAEALRLFQKAADQGHAGAQAILGWMYLRGEGGVKDDGQALKLFQKAAEQGHAQAQTTLGWMYLRGDGGVKDDAEALRLFQKAADQGHAGAKHNLALMEDIKKYRKAAYQGDVYAQHALGMMHSRGDGMPKDFIRAYALLSMAKNQGHADAAIKVDLTLKRRMTPQQISEAQSLATKCFESNYKDCD